MHWFTKIIFLFFFCFLVPLSAVAKSILSPKLVLIPKGNARLGSDSTEKKFGYFIGSKAAKKWRWFDQEKDRVVYLPDFSIDQYPITQSQYAQFVQETGHRPPYIKRDEYQKQGFLVHPYQKVVRYLWINNKPPQMLLNHPVLLVSVDDAQSYCRWRGRNNKQLYRLPTEDEWEKAARGADHQYFPWGNQWNPNLLNSAEKGPYTTTPVDQYPNGKSPYGTFDMAGNIFQWTQTPTRANSKKFILKGCSWDDAPGICRSAARHARLKTSRHLLIGFRCIREE